MIVCTSWKPESVSVPPLMAAATRSRNGRVLEAPCTVVDDARVGVDVAVEAHLVAQQAVDDLVREGHADLVVVDAVVGHVASARRSTA